LKINLTDQAVFALLLDGMGVWRGSAKSKLSDYTEAFQF